MNPYDFLNRFMYKSRIFYSFLTVMCCCCTPFLRAQTTTTIVVPLQNDIDDAEEFASGAVSLSSSDLELGGKDGSLNQITAILFRNVNIPPDAFLTNAYIQFRCDEAYTQNAVISIRAQKGNAAEFGTNARNLSSRPLTTSVVDWVTQPWLVVDERGLKERTPNLAPLIDENRRMGWGTGQNLMFRFDGNGGLATADSRESGTTNIAPELVLTYTTAAPTEIRNTTLMDSLYINEIAAKGSDDEKEDWIELYNAHYLPLVIENGVFLSDKASNLIKSELKNITIPPKSFFILVADGDTLNTPKHVNFKINNDSAITFLTRRVNGIPTLSNQLTTGLTTFKDTYGRLPDGKGATTHFTKGSYQKSNTLATIDLPIAFSQKRGFYNSAFSLTLTADPKATIRYTTDGSFPSTTKGMVYTSPILIDKSTVVKAIAYGTGGLSKMETHTYLLKTNRLNENWKYPTLLTDADYQQGLEELPVVSISTPYPISDSVPLAATFEFIEQNQLGIAVEAGIKKFGNTSLLLPKNSLRFYFKATFGSDEVGYNIFTKSATDSYKPSSKIKYLELKEGQDGPVANDFGDARFSEQVMRTTLREMGNFDPFTRFVNVFQNGKYLGLYTLREKFDDKLSEVYQGGKGADYDQINCQFDDWNRGYADQGDTLQWHQLKVAAQKNDFQRVKKMTELGDYINNMLVFLSMDCEWEINAVGLRNPALTKFRFSLNDSDGLLWGTQLWSNYTTHWTPFLFNGAGALFGNLYDGQNAEFLTMVKDRVRQHLQQPNGALSINRLAQKIDASVAQMNHSYRLDVARWGYDSTLHEVWAVQNQRIKEELNTRIPDVIRRFAEKGLVHTLEPAPVHHPSGNLVSTDTFRIMNPNQGLSVYYTLDGSDPMGNDGQLSPSGRYYNPKNPFLASGQYQIVTRAFLGSKNWGPKLPPVALNVINTIAPSARVQLFTAEGHRYGTAAVFNWMSDAFQSTHYFTVERQLPNQAFEILNYVQVSYAPLPNKTLYQFTDAHPQVDTNVYRVGMYAQGSKSVQYSPEMRLFFPKNPDFILYPNPATDVATLDLTPFENLPVEIGILNALGVELRHFEWAAAPIAFNIPAFELIEGQYFVRIRAEGKREVIRKLAIAH
ncbi:MAG: non-specific serine/threonine protein kinase, partial [Bacteroidota bacterium]